MEKIESINVLRTNKNSHTSENDFPKFFFHYLLVEKQLVIHHICKFTVIYYSILRLVQLGSINIPKNLFDCMLFLYSF